MLVARSNFENTCHGVFYNGRDIHVELRQIRRTRIGSDGDGDTKRRLDRHRNHNEQFYLFNFASGREWRIPHHSHESGVVGAVWRHARRKSCRSPAEIKRAQPVLTATAGTEAA
jgi:hypothetical protein